MTEESSGDDEEDFWAIPATRKVRGEQFQSQGGNTSPFAKRSPIIGASVVVLAAAMALALAFAMVFLR